MGGRLMPKSLARSSRNMQRDKATSEKMDIYNSEKAKGTSDADILDMIFAYNDAQPEEYKKMSGWGY